MITLSGGVVEEACSMTPEEPFLGCRRNGESPEANEIRNKILKVTIEKETDAFIRVFILSARGCVSDTV